MAKKILIILILFGAGILSFTIFPQMVSYGIGRALQYVHIAFSFLLIFLVFNFISKLEKEKKERSMLLAVHERKKGEIYKIRQSLQESSRTLGTILAQDGQAYLTFNSEGKVSLTYSRSCLDLFECEPGNMHIYDVLKLSDDEKDALGEWIKILFEELVDFDEGAPLGPSELKNNNKRKISLRYEAIRNDVGEILSVLVIAEDLTDFDKLSKRAIEKAEESEVIARLIKQKESFIFFTQEFNEGLKNFGDLAEKGDVNSETIKSYLRFLHGVKGGFLQVGLSSFGVEIHDREGLWVSILEDTSKFKEQLILDITFLQEGWVKFISKYTPIVGYSLDNPERIIEFQLSEAIDLYNNLSIISMPEKINHTFRMKLTKSIGNYFEQYQDLVQEIAKSLSKDIYPMEIIGGEIKVMPEAYKELFVSMGHLFRNSIDHGIEDPSRRAELNKDSTGKILLKFSRVNPKGAKDEKLLIEVIDDGKGINPTSLRKSLIKKGVAEVQDLDDEEVIQKIFDDGISTKSDMKDLLSGRGVGVSAVKASVESMGGSIRVTSQVNQGCHFYIEVPFIELNFNTLPTL